MRSNGEASASEESFVHQALVYASDREFVDVALPFVQEGIDSGEPTLVAVRDDNRRNLREELGDDADRATLLSVEEWYEASARTRDKFARWAEEQAGAGRARLIGEPPWPLDHDAQVRDWARHESVINVAFDAIPVTLICPYDARILPDEILEHAHGTHPEIVNSGGPSPSAAYEDPRSFCRQLDWLVESPASPPSIEMTFELPDLVKVRRMIECEARNAGLPTARVDEVVLAVNEIATNALLHGLPPAELRVWREGDELIYEVVDAGAGPDDVLAGQLRPAAEALGGRGIWLARQLCDAVEIRNGTGCTVAVRVLTQVPEQAGVDLGDVDGPAQRHGQVQLGE